MEEVEDVNEPPQELVDFLRQKGLEKYAQEMCRHPKDDYKEVNMILAMDMRGLFQLAEECGFVGEDRWKLGELVQERLQQQLVAPSIAGKLAEELKDARVEQKNNMKLFYLPFETIEERCYDFQFHEGIKPPSHPCILRVMEACLPCHFIDENISKNVVILVVGQTGAGKSTQIDGILNYLLGVKWFETVRFKVVDEKMTVMQESRAAGEAVSQTDTVTAYRIPAIKGGPVKSWLTIVDTPGFGDTRGLHFDAKIVDQMKRFFREFPQYIASLSGVCFITQASAARLTESQQYVWDAILGLFGKDIAENIIPCFTFADGEQPQALDAVKACGIPMPMFFKFNNSALFVDPHGQQTDAVSKMFWDMGKKSMKEFMNALMSFTPKSLHLTQEVMQEREQLEATLEGLGPQVTVLLGHASNLQKTAEQVKMFDETMQGSKDFKVTVDAPKFRKTPTMPGENTTTCMNCDRTCHKSCKYKEDAKKARCSAMTPFGLCKVCPRKCSWRDHTNLPYVIEWYTEKQEKTLDDLKATYDAANEGIADKTKILDGLMAELQKTHEILADFLVRVKNCKQRLAEIAMRPNVMPSEDYIQIMIENEKNNQRLGFQDRIKVLQKLKTQSEMLRKAEDPNFTQQLLKDFGLTLDQNIKRAVRPSKGNKRSESWSVWSLLGYWMMRTFCLCWVARIQDFFHIDAHTYRDICKSQIILKSVHSTSFNCPACLATCV